MLYNVSFWGKRYKRKTKEQALKILDDNKLMVEQFAVNSYNNIVREIACIGNTVTRVAFFDVYGKVIFSLNKTKK